MQLKLGMFPFWPRDMQQKRRGGRVLGMHGLQGVTPSRTNKTRRRLVSPNVGCMCHSNKRSHPSIIPGTSEFLPFYQLADRPPIRAFNKTARLETSRDRRRCANCNNTTQARDLHPASPAALVAPREWRTINWRQMSHFPARGRKASSARLCILGAYKSSFEPCFSPISLRCGMQGGWGWGCTCTDNGVYIPCLLAWKFR